MEVSTLKKSRLSSTAPLPGNLGDRCFSCLLCASADGSNIHNLSQRVQSRNACLPAFRSLILFKGGSKRDHHGGRQGREREEAGGYAIPSTRVVVAEYADQTTAQVKSVDMVQGYRAYEENVDVRLIDASGQSEDMQQEAIEVGMRLTARSHAISRSKRTY